MKWPSVCSFALLPYKALLFWEQALAHCYRTKWGAGGEGGRVDGDQKPMKVAFLMELSFYLRLLSALLKEPAWVIAFLHSESPCWPSSFEDTSLCGFFSWFFPILSLNLAIFLAKRNVQIQGFNSEYIMCNHNYLASKRWISTLQSHILSPIHNASLE